MDLVQDFLGAHGYSETQEKLKEEFGTAAHQGPSSPGAQSKLESILRDVNRRRVGGQQPFPAFAPSLDAEGLNHPQRYAESYASLQEWLAGSLENYKAEMATVSFPLFVLCYLKLVAQVSDPVEKEEQGGAEEDAGGEEKAADDDEADRPPTPGELAAGFMGRWGAEHDVHYRSDMRSLRSITAKRHLDTDDYARLVLGSKDAKEVLFLCPPARPCSSFLPWRRILTQHRTSLPRALASPSASAACPSSSSTPSWPPTVTCCS